MNKQKFDTLQEQLHDHHIKRIGNAFTRSPLFLVQVKRIAWGYEEEYSEEHAIYFDDAYYHTSQEFYYDHSFEDPEELEYFLEGNISETAKNIFREDHKGWNLNQLWEWIDCYLPDNEYCFYHGNPRWETINYFITRKQAENFVESKSGKGKPNVRIYVDSLYRSNEFEILLEAIAKGEVVWKGEE